MNLRCLISIVLLSSSGCAVGYGVGTTSAKLSPTADPRVNFPEDLDVDAGTFFHEFRIIDTTGFVLAALVNAGRQHNARQDAIEQAQYQRPDREGNVRVEYSYEPMPILSGLVTDTRLRLGLGAGSLDFDGLEVADPGVTYWALDVRSEFYTFRLIDGLPMVSSLWLSTKFENWDSADNFNAFIFDMYAGTSTTYIIRPDVMATGRVGLGILSPLLGALSGGSLLNVIGELEVGWKPLPRLMISGVLAIGREFAVDRSAVVPRAGVNLSVSLGPQAVSGTPATTR